MRKTHPACPKSDGLLAVTGAVAMNHKIMPQTT